MAGGSILDFMDPKKNKGNTVKSLTSRLMKFLPRSMQTALTSSVSQLTRGFGSLFSGSTTQMLGGLRGIVGGVGKLATKVAAPIYSVVKTVKGIGDFFFSDKLLETGVGGFLESMGGTGASIIEGLTFGGSKYLTNMTGLTVKGFDTDDLAGARAIYRNNNPDAPTAIPNETLLKDIQANPTDYPESYLEQAKKAQEIIDAGDVTIRTLPEDTLAFAGGTQFGKETNDLLRELIAAVNQGGDILMDGRKVGSTLQMASFKL